MEDASLDQFARSSEDDGEDSSNEQGGQPASAAQDTIEAATPKSRWTPDGEPCEECGETTTRLWDDDGQFCCRVCKEW